MSAPRFTILMPTHYRPDSIGHAIASVLAQTETSFELLVVGDGAVAGTAEVVASFADPRIRWFDFPKAPHYGYANRERAMAEARGELVAFAADDDLMLPDHLEHLGKAFGNPEVQWAYSQALWVSDDGIAAPDFTNVEFDDELAVFTGGNTIAGGSLVYRASAMAGRAHWPSDVEQSGDWHQMVYLLRRYGLQGLHRVRLPTLLHFVAGRKGVRHSHFPLLRAWLAVADEVPWWPDALRLPASDALPQAAYRQRLQDPSFPARLRAAALDVTGRVALDALAPRTPTPAPLRTGEIAELDELRRQRDTYRQTVEAMRASSIWRATQPLRDLLERLRGVHRP